MPTGEKAHIHQTLHRAHHQAHPPDIALEDLPAIPPVTHIDPVAAPAPSKELAPQGVILPADPFKVQAHQAIPAVRISQRAASAG